MQCSQQADLRPLLSASRPSHRGRLFAAETPAYTDSNSEREPPSPFYAPACHRSANRPRDDNRADRDGSGYALSHRMCAGGFTRDTERVCICVCMCTWCVHVCDAELSAATAPNLELAPATNFEIYSTARPPPPFPLLLLPSFPSSSPRKNCSLIRAYMHTRRTCMHVRVPV